MISVIIPVYNREKTIKRAIMSVLNQSYRDMELIVIDDGSTDNSANVIQEIRDERLKYVYQPNQGACAARNHGIDIAKGDYIAFHDSDDIWLPEKLKIQYEALLANKADVIFCKMADIGTYGTVDIPKKLKEGFLSDKCSLINIGTQSILGRRCVFSECRFDNDMPRLQDFELLYRIVKKYSVYYLDTVLVEYYTGDNSISSSGQKFVRSVYMLRQKHPELFSKRSASLNDIGKISLAVANQLIAENNIHFKQCMKMAIAFLGWPGNLAVSGMYKAGLYPAAVKIYYYFRHRQKRPMD